MEKREPQTSKRPTQRDDQNDSMQREQDTRRNPNEASQNKGDADRAGRQNPNQSHERASQSQDRIGESHGRSDDESDDETSSTPGGNPARGVNPGTSNPAPGSAREQQTPGCEGLGSSTCGQQSSGQTLGEPDQSEQRPL